MRIVPFPDHDDGAPEQAWLAELEAALGGAATGPEAESWRELREDVRSLAPPMSADFERELARMLASAIARARHGEAPPSACRRPRSVGLARLRALTANCADPAGMPSPAPRCSSRSRPSCWRSS